MNYMDLTFDACTNLFTNGQKDRMWAQFDEGGPRHSLFSSVGLLPPLISEIPLPEEPASGFGDARLYPNPAEKQLSLDLSYDVRWIGKQIFIRNAQGATVITQSISSKLQQIDISRLAPGLYFLYAKKEDGATIKQKFIKR